MPGDAVQIETVGLARLIASLGALQADLAEIAPPEAAQAIGSAAQQRAPKRSGALAASLFSATASGRVTVGFGARHAGPLNFGVGPRTGMRGPHNIAATRFLTGAASEETVWIDSYMDDIETAIGKVKGA
jgi:hypothetical protein